MTIGDGAYVGAGTTVTEDVPDGALALSAFPAGQQARLGGPPQGPEKRGKIPLSMTIQAPGEPAPGSRLPAFEVTMCGIVGYVGPRQASPLLSRA